jgi:hypothetical protein
VERVKDEYRDAASSRALAAQLDEVSPTDPLVFASGTLLLATVSLLTSRCACDPGGPRGSDRGVARLTIP